MRLAELQKMNDAQLAVHWSRGRFPFDFARCTNCMTMHDGYGTDVDSMHSVTYHCPIKLLGVSPRETRWQRFLGRVTGIRKPRPFTPWLRENLERLFALRLFYADQYAMPVPEEAWLDAEALKVAVNETALELVKSL